MRVKFCGLLLVALLFAALAAAPGCIPKSYTPRSPHDTYYRINTKSRIFHKPGCPHYRCQHCRPGFNSCVQAIAAGYRPCRVCKP